MHAFILTIPRSALIEEDGETAVFVVEKAPPPKPDAKKDDANKNVAKADAKVDAKVDAKNATAVPPESLVAHRRIVKIGYSDGDHVEIRGGVDEGARVITVGRNAVRDGTAVQVIGDAPAKPQALADNKKPGANG